MAMPITCQDVYRVMVPWLGSLYCNGTPTVSDVADCLSEYSPNRNTLMELHEKLETLLLVRLNRYTNSTLLVYMENGRRRQITRQVLSAISDDLMGIVFDKLTVFSANYVKLNDYSMKVQSLNAMRVLYQKYASFYSEEELTFLVDMIKSIFPVACYQSWLKEEE